MNSDYFKNFISLKHQSRSAYDSFLLHIKHSFQKLKAQPNNINSQRLHSELNRLKEYKELKHKDRKEIFKYCIQQNVKDLKFYRSNNNKWLAIMKLTKTSLDNYQLDWKSVWENLVQSQPQVPTTKLYADIKQFLSLLRHLYNPDNALQVLNYFISHYSLTENAYIFISLFANISRKTSKQVILGYIKRLLELYYSNQLKASNLLVMFINASKFQYQEIPSYMHEQFNKIILYSLTTPVSDKKDTIETKFNTDTVNITIRILGKANQHSCILLSKIFQLIKNFIRPFQDSKKPLRFLLKLMRGISKRIQAQKNARTKIQKLKLKDQRKKKKLLKKQEEQEQKSKRLKEKLAQQTIQSLQNNEQSAVTQAGQPNTQKQQKKNDQQQDSDQDNEDQQQSQEEQQLQKIQKMMGMQIQKDDKNTQKVTEIQTKIENLQNLFKNQITTEIKDLCKTFLESIFQDIFYVNSKKNVSNLLAQIFNMYPQFIDKAFICLEKASNIPQINQQGLISNILCMAKYLFVQSYRSSPQFLQNVMKILTKIQQNRRITDVWSIFNVFVQKIPLLDEKDYQLIQQKQKTQFYTKFNQNHDRFYEQYSELVFQSLKRLLSQSLHFDDSTSRLIDRYLQELFSNCHKHYKLRVFKLIQSEIYQNNNKFLISMLNTYMKPTTNTESQLKQLVQNRNIDSQENLQLDVLINIVLSVNMDIEESKKLIRKYSKKNNFKYLRQCMMNLNNITFIVVPRDSSLSHFTQKPNLSIVQQPSYQLISTKLAHVHAYSLELIDNLLQELKQFQENSLQSIQFKQIVQELYGSKQNTYKNMKVEKRKTINELLQILKIIVQNLFNQLQELNQQKNIIQYRKPSYERTSLIQNPNFIKILNCLTYNQIFLHDQNIMRNVSQIVQLQTLFIYKHHIRFEADLLDKYRKYNRQQLTGQTNFNNSNNIYITKMKIMHLAQLSNKYKDSISIQSLNDQLRLLMLAPGNQKISHINKIFLSKLSNLQAHAQTIISLLSILSSSRFFYEKVFTLLKQLTQTGYQYTSSQIIKIIDNHAPLLQSQTAKIREMSLKSFQKFVSSLPKTQIIGQVQRECQKYMSKQKYQIIWIMFVIIVVKEPLRNIPVQQYLLNIKGYLENLTKFIMSDSRLLRRIALFTYSLCLRKAKQVVRQYQVVQSQTVEYQKFRSAHQIFDQGYIRDQHLNSNEIANRISLKKIGPYNQYVIKKKVKYSVYEEIEASSFDFIMKDVDLGDKVLRLFHADMAGSLQQAMSIMQGKNLDLSQVTFKLLQGSYVYCKLKKLNFDKIEYYFGQRFFRYLFNKDAKNGYIFFNRTKSFLDELMTNFESYDNQNLIFTYTMDLMLSYQKNYEQIRNDKVSCEKVQEFLLKIIRQIIYKGSGALFKKVLIILQKITNKQCLSFLTRYINTLLEQKQKISRTTQLLTKINGQSYEKYKQLLSYCLAHKIQLNNTYILTLIQNVINLPQKYILHLDAVTKYKFIDLQGQLKERCLQRYGEVFYMLNIHEFNTLLLQKLQDYLRQANQINNKLQSISAKQNEIQKHKEQESEKAGLQLLKNKNQSIKIIFSIVVHAANSFIQYYQTEQTIKTLLNLIQFLFRLFQFKMELIIDFKLVQALFKAVFVNKFENIQHFQAILNIIMGSITKLSIKRQAQLVNIIAHRPANLLFLSKSSYVRLIKQIVAIEQNLMIYKDLLVNLATILAYVPLKQQEISQIVAELSNKSHKTLLMQSYVLSTIDIGSLFVKKILKQSGKDRRNIFCKQLLVIRGKKQYLDDEQKYQQWKQIKQYSNPYHYHA